MIGTPRKIHGHPRHFLLPDEDPALARCRILIVDDDNLVRIGLRTLLQEDDQLEVVGEAGNGRDAVRLARRLEPDIVIMDVSMPDLNGIDATERLCATATNVRVLAMSMHREGRFVRRMLDAGASGYVPKTRALEEISTAIHAVAAGRTYISPEVTSELLEAMAAGDGDTTASLADLSVREREVLQLLAEGHSAGQIADALNLSVKTVETHRRRVMQKLDLDGVAELTRFAIRHGLVALD